MGKADLPVPLVSVVIPCYNARPWIEEALASVFSQDVSGLEVIVVDDGSSDGSAAVVGRYPWVRLVSTDRVASTVKRGPSIARNIGTRLSCGRFIQYLDADDVLAPGKLRRQVDALEGERADVAYGDWEKWLPAPEGKLQRIPVVGRQIDGDPSVALLSDFWLPIHVYLYRRRIVEATGGWRESLAVIQDARFTFDCAARGARFVYCPGVVAAYRIHSAGSVSTSDPTGFVRDCLLNAAEVERFWAEDGGVNEPRRKALLKCYGHVARASFERDRPTFEKAYAALMRLEPAYTPRQPRHLALASFLVGYRRAEALALLYRRGKKHFVR